MFLRHHGILVAGRELGAAIDDLYMLEKAAQLQVLASGLGPLTPIGDETIERTRDQFADGMIEWGRAALGRVVSAWWNARNPTSATSDRLAAPPYSNASLMSCSVLASASAPWHAGWPHSHACESCSVMPPAAAA